MYEEAEKAFFESIKIREDLLGKDHIDLAMYTNLGSVKMKMN